MKRPSLPRIRIPRPNIPKPKFPEEPPPGPTRPTFWKSPLRGPWLSSIIGSALLPLIIICAVTGFLSHAAYNPTLGDNSFFPAGGISVNIYFFSWPTVPTFLYAVTQGLHVISGVIAIVAATSHNATRLFFKVFGLVYTIAGVWGFWQNGEIYTMHMNTADNIFHLTVGLIALFLGFASKRDNV